MSASSRQSPRQPLQSRQYLAELTALTEAGLAILRAQMDLDDLCELVYEHTGNIVDTSSFHLGLFEGDHFVMKIWVKEGERQPPAAFAGAPESGIIGWMRATQQPLLVSDFTLEMDDLPARPSYMAERPPRSAIFVPLVAGSTVVGTMSAQSARPNAYNEDDLQILGIIANQAASAIINERLFQRERRRADQLATIVDVGRAITAILDLDDLLTTVVELIQERFDYYHAQVFLVEHETHRAYFRASSGHRMNQLWREERRSMHFDEGIIGWVAGMGQHLLANDVSTEPRYVADDPRLLSGTRSELAVPLKIEDEVLGVLDVQSRQLNRFGEEDLFILNALANQVAVAVDAARSYRAQQEEAWITTVLLQVAEAANQVETLDDVLGAVTRLIPMLTGVKSCGVWLRDEERDVYELAATYEMTMPWKEAGAALDMHPAVERTPALALINDERQPLELERGDALLPAAIWQAMPGDTLILLPLLAQTRQIGLLLVSLDRGELPVRARPKRLTMLGGIANQAAAAIENVRLATAQQEEAWISWALLEVSKAIGNAPSQDEMLAHVVRLTPLLAGVDRCAALLFDPAGETFVVAKEYLGHGAHQPGRSFEGRILRPGDLPLLDLARITRRLQRVDDVRESDLVPPRWAEEIGSRTLAALPLAAQDEVLGMLLVDDVDASHMLSQRREDILTGIAQQVSLALENFRLQIQERERERLAQELQVARRIQTSFLPDVLPDVPGYQVARLWQSAREVGGDLYDLIALPDGWLGLLVGDVADKGVPAALFMATSLTLLRVSVQNYPNAPQRALTRANHLICANNNTDMFVTVWFGVLDPANHSLIYANAGHSLALHVQATGGEIRRLQTPGLPLGVFDPPNVEQASCELAPGDLLILYSDGVLDALNEAGEEFGQARLESLLFAQRSNSAEVITDAIIGAVRGHTGDAPFFDDLTLIVVKRTTS